MARRSYTLSAAERKVMKQFAKCSIPVCFYCWKTLSAREVKVDHKMPVSRGGATVAENLAICCERCNSEKGQKTTDEFFLYLEFKYSCRSYTTKGLLDYLNFYRERLRETQNPELNDGDGLYIRWKCQAIEKILKERAHEIKT